MPSKEKYSNISKVELLPFHKMGEFKWAELGLKYELADTMEPELEVMNTLNNALNE